MGNKSIRIQTNAGGTDKYVKVKLEQDINLIEILSLQISQKDLYASFNADFGVLVGRVIANGGVGIPNAKLSIFIPVTDEDKNNSDIFSIYPYTSPRDKNLDGVRYNLLPRVAINNPFLVAGDYSPKTPIGTFPTKEEITTNPTYLEVYKKYFKYTTITNSSGDYMFYGIPVGVQTVHMSVDVTDIGKYSMTPGSMITQLGYSPFLFDQNGTTIKFSTDLDTLPNVETQEIAVDVKPFWGDTDNFEIGITRQDFKIRATLVNTFTVFGSAFTDSESGSVGRGGSTIKQLYTMFGGDPSPFLSMDYKRIGTMHETIMYVPNTVDESVITGNTLNPETDFKQMFTNQYTTYVDKGVYVYIIPCNRKKIITDEFGRDQIISNDDNRGVFTEFCGFFIMQYSDYTELPINRVDQYKGHVPDERRFNFKIPQQTMLNAINNVSIPSTDDVTYKAANDAWRIQNKIFTAGSFYSVARFHGTSNSDDNSGEGNTTDNWLNNSIHYYMGGHIFTNSATGTTGGTAIPSVNQLVPNDLAAYNPTIPIFAYEWLNFSLYFPQYTFYGGAFSDAGRSRLLNADNRHLPPSVDNNILIAGKLKNTVNLARADIHPTAFIEVPKTDIINIINFTIQGLTKLGFRNGVDPPFDTTPLTGTEYKTVSGTQYMYKGLGSAADVFLFLRQKNLI